MREVESESKKRPLIADRSCQQTTSESDRSPSQPEGEPHSHSHFNSHSPPSPQTIFILFILAIVLPIATIFAGVFELKSRGFGAFNVGFNVLNNELEKSGLNNNEYGGRNGPHTAAPAIDSNNKICLTGVRLRGFDNIGCVFNGNIDDNGLQYDVSFGM